MGLTIGTADSATISTSEYSLPADTTTSVPTSQTGDGLVAVWLDCNALAAGDLFRLRVYEKVGSGATQRVGYEAYLSGPVQPVNQVFGPFTVGDGWDITLLKISGTDRSILWRLDTVT